MAPRNDPFGEMDRLFEQMRRNVMEAWNGPTGARGGWSYRPAFDSYAPTAGREAVADDSEMATYEGTTDVNLQVERTDGELVVLADLPGFERSEIDASFDDGLLTIEAVHEVDEEDRFRTRRVFERARLGDDVIAQEASATYSNGVLELRFPFAEAHDDVTSIDIE
ncbi:MAG: Hsp20/alpha crystallin family protein [Halosimplex sp.]